MRTVLCKIEGCTSKARRRGRCKKHFRLWKIDNPIVTLKREPENRKAYSVNDYRCLWEFRKKRRQLCSEWLDLAAFAAGVHPKPEGPHKLWRLDTKRPFGPDNFEWRKKTVMLSGETEKEYNARMRRETLARFPNFERDRMLRRNYGITPERFYEMLASQNHACAICERAENTLSRVQKGKRLSVDHCHETGIIRGLLCFECNTSLGKLGESVERLEAMIRYIKKHKQPKLTIVASNS